MTHRVVRLVGFVFSCMALSAGLMVQAADTDPSFWDSTSTTYEPSSSSTVLPTSTVRPTESPPPCESSPCANGGTCFDEKPGFRCHCRDNFDGELCDRPVNPDLFPFGDTSRDKRLYGSDDGQTTRQWVDHGVQIYCHRYRSFFVSVNGFMSFLGQYWGISPPPSYALERVMRVVNAAPVVLAPFWADGVTGNTGRAEDGTVYYHSYTKYSRDHVVDDNTNAVMHKANAVVRQQTGRVNFETSNALVITWSKLRRFGGSDDEVNTFQVVVMSDHSTYETFVQYNYNDLAWTPSTSNAIFTYARMNPYWSGYIMNRYFLSGTSLAFRMPGIEGNTGQVGSLLYRLSSDQCLEYRGAEYRCRVWSVNQQNNAVAIFRQHSFLFWFMPCPCTLQQAIIDPWFRYTGQDLCFVSQTIPAQRCCYDRSRIILRILWMRFWIFIFWDHPLMVQQIYQSGSFTLNNEFWQRWGYELEDRGPKEDCCLGSNLCNVYYSYRPLNRCWFYRSPFRAWLFGDPHIRTTDGKSYTYNGRGEFWLQKPTETETETPEDDRFRLQGRTDYAWDSQDRPQQATVFVAFAAKDKDTGRVHVGLNEDRTKLIIRGSDVQDDITDWYYNTTDDATPELELNNVTFRRLVDSVYVVFPSGVAVSAGVGNNQLDILFVVTQNYSEVGNRGLFGVYNGDPDDDLTTPDGTVISSNKSEDLGYIHTEFGEKWRISDTESLFWYEEGSGSSDFQDPDFEAVTELAWESEEEKRQADELCQGDQVCYYDLFVTKDKDFAASTMNTSTKNEESEKDLRNSLPLIDGPDEIEVRVLDESSATITVSDADSEDTVTMTPTIPEGATYDTITGLFEWTPEDMSEVEIRFSSMDSKNASGPDLVITVKLCNCSDHGKCDFDHSLPEYNTTDTFQIVFCECDPQWTGDQCQLDFDACENDPCLALQDCTDLSPQEHTLQNGGFNCSACPDGYITAVGGTKCLDINECLNGADDCVTSTTECVNTIGGFSCDCLAGFEPVVGDTSSCGDVDECDLLLDDCEHICTNEPGGYACECHDGYILDVNGTDCIEDDTDALLPCIGVTCEGGVCVVIAGDPVCKCPSGFELAADDVTCNDIDECGVNHQLQPCGTSGHPNCTNTEGSYKCECFGGILAANLRSCEVCEEPWWGTDCSSLCDCANDTTECDPVTGCSACRPGWDGGECKEDIDECAEGKPCGVHTTCNNTIGSYSCLCDEGYEMTLDGCSDIDECDPNSQDSMADECFNDSECVDGFLDVTCICTSGFTGDRCEINIDECLLQNETHRCLHNSTCVDKVNAFECECTDDYYGHFCQHIVIVNPTESPPEDDSFPVALTVLGVIVGTVLLTLLVIVLCTCCRKYARRQRDVTSMTSATSFSRPSHQMPSPSWMHWYPGGAKPTSLVGRSQVPVRQGRGQQRDARPPIDWSILRKVANRPGHQSPLHRGPAPYNSNAWLSGSGSPTQNRPQDGKLFSWRPV